MSNQGQGGGRNPPPDDRTLLDPLSNDELKALREARQRMQQKKGGGANHQIVIGPDSGEDIGDAPTRAMPALPSFEAAGVSLDKISTNANQPLPDPAERGGPMPNEPMSVHGTHPMGGRPQGGPLPTKPAGFGENTLLWMQPPKPPPAVTVGAATGDILPPVDKKTQAVRKLKTYSALAVLAIVIGALLFVTTQSREKGVLELHTTPPKARVAINGRASNEVTPMKLTLPEGSYEIEVVLDGYEPHKFSTDIVGGEKVEPIRKDIDLQPISKEGFYTVSINISPIAANIVLDETVHAGKRTLKVPNIDPNRPHRIVVEAGGYVKIEQDIPVGQLKTDYNFVLQKE
jgi:hypothetical protein